MWSITWSSSPSKPTFFNRVQITWTRQVKMHALFILDVVKYYICIWFRYASLISYYILVLGFKLFTYDKRFSLDFYILSPKREPWWYTWWTNKCQIVSYQSVVISKFYPCVFTQVSVDGDNIKHFIKCINNFWYKRLDPFRRMIPYCVVKYSDL